MGVETQATLEATGFGMSELAEIQNATQTELAECQDRLYTVMGGEAD